MPREARRKIVGLVPARNESGVIAQCLRCLARFTDAIVYLDDCSTDDSVEIVRSLAEKHDITVLTKEEWHRDEPGDRNRLLQAGREVGGTDFVVIDADEAFTANFAEGAFLRKRILELDPGDQMGINWIQLWRTHKRYRFDDSIWTYCYKNVIFRDDGKCGYRSGFIHTLRVPPGLSGKVVKVEGYERGLMHFQFVNWRNLLVKQSWYQCLERTRTPKKLTAAINARYAGTKSEKGLGAKPSHEDWFAGYDVFDPSVYARPSTWYEEHVLRMIDEYSLSFFKDLDIWNVDWGERIAEPDVNSRAGICFSQLRKARIQLAYDFDRAAQMYSRILEEFGASEAEYGLALCDWKQQNGERALQRCENVIRRSPNYTDAYNLAGQIAWARRDATAAEKYYSKALEIDPLFLDAQINADAMIWG
jgi:glycosyltransferase involved in cell wall biosynthesis